ncbi:WD40 repeat-like protein [Linderina pennispora]|uniref:WD40 repeat-like protein n=1 Tax=Linderina pennispora TaxID=61395 RepID=A0A1Y1WI68_9FUNG|nr:WD40 repeat-like protein [Linderina pennispora]ORX73271.1 WD40 repeat-like protein [Linderina pennispora]
MGLSDELNKFIPKDFGKKKKKAVTTAHTTKQTKSTSKPAAHPRTPTPPADLPPAKDLPISHHFRLSEHSKTVSALSWDASGDTLLTGDHQSLVKLWDFTSMDQAAHSLRTLSPFESQRICQIKFLCASSDPRVKLFDADGHKLCEFRRGDMYVSDMRRTSGHVSGVTCVDWRIGAPQQFLSASQDGTVRLWDCNQPHKQLAVIVAKSRTRTAVTAAKYTLDGKAIIAAQQDGALAVWPTDGPYMRPAQLLNGAHQGGSETTCVELASPDTFLTRSTDDTVKLWDLRKFTEPLAQHDLETPNEANLALSPDTQHVLAGVSNGQISVLDRQTLTPKHAVTVPETTGGIVRIAWHAKLNQIACTSTDGSTTVLFDPETSQAGALLCYDRKPRRQFDQVATSSTIITPHALPLFREDRPMSAKRRREKELKKAVKPKMLVHGHGHGGEIGINETQHIMKSLIKDTLRDEDPREALLKYARVAEEDPKFIAPAYKGTQDKPVFDESGMADEPAMKRRK